jgi:4-phosphopantoate--beta-alanine ligase
MDEIFPDHPRAESLRIRRRLTEGMKAGMVVPEGLAAHGRGEAFDYLLGERSTEFAREAAEAASAALLLASHPVISVNGNTAVLVPEGVAELAEVTGAKVEVNLFHRSPERELLIAEHLKKHGCREVLGLGEENAVRLPEIRSERRKADRRGIFSADVVLVPLEDGDRTEALQRMGKLVIAVDLNPLSRTARAARITLVDNVVRAFPLMVEGCRKMIGLPRETLKKKVETFDNERNLRESLRLMCGRLEELFDSGGHLFK